MIKAASFFPGFKEKSRRIRGEYVHVFLLFLKSSFGVEACERVSELSLTSIASEKCNIMTKTMNYENYEQVHHPTLEISKTAGKNETSWKCQL